MQIKWQQRINNGNKNEKHLQTIKFLNEYCDKLISEELNLNEIMGVEGRSARIYFEAIFDNMDWKGRKHG